SIFKPSIQGDENKQLLKTKQTEGIFYNGPQSDYFYTNRRFKDYNVQLDPIKWELTSESKEILGYTCHRALGAKVYNDSITSDQTIEAWYTRDINVT
ncbi:GLPGLI family protein, partial [Aquimarina celericrescens]|nr:GLPGLI family protein [Aquimarina celericrescens]